MEIPQKTAFSDIDIGPGIKGVLLDLDNTIYEYASCHEAALSAVHETHHKKITPDYGEFKVQYSAAQKAVKSRIPRHGASHSRLLYFQNLIEMRDGKTDFRLTKDSDDLYWSTFHKAVSLRKDAVSFIKSCREKGIKICLVTDLTASVQFHKIIEIGADDLFDLIVTSEEAGAEKPDAAIFGLALQKLGLSPGETIMVGDDKIKDINGAHTLGIKAYLV